MKILKILILAALLIATAGCVSTRYDSVIEHAVTMCKELNGLDAPKAEGEVSFWLQSERAEASRKLWNRRGFAALKARQTNLGNPADRACIDQLYQEAFTHQLMRE